MNRLPLLLATLLLPATLHAVPGNISYQGIVTDPAGVPIGNAAPENREAIFRIWKVATGGGLPDLVYSEKQTATIANGEFSVLIGTGAETDGAPIGLDETGLFGPAALAAAFDGTDRFLEVTIADGSGSLATPITPRQQIVSTAYAMRAGVAESAQSFGLGDGSIVYDEGSQTMTLATAGTTRLTIDSTGRTTLGLAGTTNQPLDVYQPSYYHDFLAFTDPDDGQFDRIGMYFDTSNDSLRFEDNYRDIDLMTLTDTGRLGVGTTSPESTLHVSNGNSGVATNFPNSEAEPTLLLENDANTTMQFKAPDGNLSGLVFGNSVSPRHGTIYYDNDATGNNGQMLFRTGNISAYPMVIGANGNVGVGTQAPETFLHVQDGEAAGVGLAYPTSTKMVIESSAGAYMQFQTPTGTVSGLVFGSGDSDNDGAIFYANGTTGNNKALYFRTGGSTIDRMAIAENGNVGIGTSNPEKKLHIIDSVAVGTSTSTTASAVIERNTDHYLQLKVGDNNVTGLQFGTPDDPADGGVIYDDNSTSGDNMQFRVANNTTRMIIKNNGNVGIGTTNPSYPLEVLGSTSASGGNSTYFGISYLGLVSDPSLDPTSVSVNASNWYRGLGYVANSDARIKEIRGRSDSEVDLGILAELEVTNYTYVDKVAQGGRPQKKLIAQQVEAVFPHAVSRSKDVIPDIFQEASLHNGWVGLETDLTVGERVRLITESETKVYEVLEVRDGAFRTGMDVPDEKVFVYGREVDDFRTVDYDAISMLNVSATQELHRRLQASESEVEALKERIAELEARDRARDERLSAIEALLKPTDRGEPRTVSVK